MPRRPQDRDFFQVVPRKYGSQEPGARSQKPEWVGWHRDCTRDPYSRGTRKKVDPDRKTDGVCSSAFRRHRVNTGFHGSTGYRVNEASRGRSYARAAILTQHTMYLECGGSTPLFSGPPRRPGPREPRLAAQGGAKAPHFIKMPGWHHAPVPIIDFLRRHQI